MYINGRAHGPMAWHYYLQLHMRHFKDGDTVVVEPWRGSIISRNKGPVVDRSHLTG